MFVAASDISVDSMPRKRKERKDWKQTIKCRVFITSNTMSMALPAISSGMNVLEQITKNANTTYKLFVVDNFQCLATFVYDGAGNGKPTGYLVTCHENGGNYYFAERAS